MTEDEPPRQKNYVAVAGQLLAIAFEFSGSVVAGVWLGYFADGKLGTAPWLLILFTLLGTSTGFYRMIQIVRHFQKNA